MTTKPIVLTAVFCLFAIHLWGQPNSQCDSITIYDGEFDRLFQKQYKSIKADTVLAVRHCGNTNGCGNTFGLLCWKADGQYHFKKLHCKNAMKKLDFELEGTMKDCEIKKGKFISLDIYAKLNSK